MSQISSETTTYLRGAERAPVNRALEGARRPRAGSIHDDAVATKLGFRGGTIAGSVHMDQFVPVLIEAFGPAWFETGSLSLSFRNATISGDPVIAMVGHTGGPADAQRGVEVSARMERPDGTVVAEGTASVGPVDEATSHLRTVDLRPTDPGTLRILKGVEPGAPMLDHEVTADGKLLTARIEAGAMTEPLDWYTGPSPWGGPVAAPSATVQLLRNRAGDFGPEADANIGSAVGLFGAIEIRHHAGPVLLGETYSLSGQVVTVGSSPKTEYVWYDTRARDAEGRLVASMRMQLRWMTASSPLYASEQKSEQQPEKE